MDARADPRRPRGDRRRTEERRRGRPRSTARASHCSKPIIRARRPCSTRRRASPAISPAAARPRRPRRCSATSSIRSRTPATSRRASPTSCGPMSTCCSRRRRPGGDRRNFRRDPADGPPRPRPDPGRACARAKRRHRRSVAPVPPIGDADPAGRAQPDRARAARRTSPSRRRRSARARVLRASLEQTKRNRSRPRRRWPASRATAPCRRGHPARRPAKDASPGRSLLPDDDRRRPSLRDAGHADRRRARRKLDATAQAARRAGRCAARDHLDGRERPAHHLRVRRRAVAPDLRRAVRPVRRASSPA